jgi:hypothetical protein
LKDIYFSIFHGEVGVDTIFLYNGYMFTLFWTMVRPSLVC